MTEPNRRDYGRLPPDWKGWLFAIGLVLVVALFLLNAATR